MAALIRAAGGEPVLFPALEILDAADLRPVLALIERLDAFDLAIFISANAVEKALALVEARRAWPAGLRVATVGRGSERELQRHGFGAVIAPSERFDSEGLLELPELKQVARQAHGDFSRRRRTRAARGNARRAQRHGQYAECYRRGRPTPMPRRCSSAARGATRCVHRDLERGPGQPARDAGRGRAPCLEDTPLFAPHERIAAAARALGVRTVVLTGPGDEGLIAGLAAFFAKV